MLDDRSYMRQGSSRGQLLLTHWLIIINVCIFALQEINRAYVGLPVNEYLALSPEGLRQGFLWQLVTFQFLHGSGWHLVGNIITIYFFGRMVEERMGSIGLLKVYLLSGIAGGVLQSILAAVWPQHFRAFVYGASAGGCGLLAAAAALDPGCTLLLWFVLPIRVRYVVFIIGAISVFYIFVPNSNIAHGAHLGGILGGLAYMRWGAAVEDFFRARRTRAPRLRPRELMRVRGSKAPAWQRSREAEDIPPEEFISREVDPILDKISAHGLQSLTPRERQILEAARSKMEKR